MKHDARLPRDDVNITPRHPLKEGAVMLVGLAMLVALGFIAAVLVVERTVPYVPVSWESKLFPELDTIRHEPETPEQEAREKKLEALLTRLVKHWPDHPPDLRVGLLEMDEPNALAFPGGLILVSTGLIEKVESENELAFVLGHELGHYRHRDHLRSLGRGVALAVILTALGRSGAVGEIIGTSTELSTRSFSRGQESEADAFGLGLVHEEFGHVNGATKFFERLPEPGRMVEKAIATYLATHPLTDERVRAIERLARDNGWPERGEITEIVY